ncbi:hypothetical protein DFR56_108164 [Pseudogracilibacillus auburnensis]|uniref:Uncharacterized protein n=1 Tax=Pseudogracilibacillus auburnensis TaxID=1494959 RepID=A0A2V3W265_9BACI|nr:hypothetical protein DFR56_108164 [Pseudogracilibacillus auburnensis]
MPRTDIAGQLGDTIKMIYMLTRSKKVTKHNHCF